MNKRTYPQTGMQQTKRVRATPPGEKKKSYVEAVTGADHEIPTTPTTPIVNKESVVTALKEKIVRVPVNQMISDKNTSVWPAEQYLEIPRSKDMREGMNKILIRGYVFLGPFMKHTGPTKALLTGRFLIRTFNSIQTMVDGALSRKDVQSATIWCVGFDRVAEGIQLLNEGDFIEIYGYINSRAYDKILNNDPAQSVKIYENSITIRSLTKFVDPIEKENSDSSFVIQD